MLREYLPSIFTRVSNDDFSEWVEAHQDEIDRFLNDLDAIEKSFEVANASGQHLDLIGDEYGELGKRRGRNDPAYRSFLTTLVAAFDGRGTAQGIKTAVAAGLVRSPSDITHTPDFVELEYDLTLTSWSGHLTSTITELADLADPSCVKLNTVNYVLDGEEVRVKAAECEPKIVDTGLSSDELGDLSSGEWDLSQ